MDANHKGGPPERHFSKLLLRKPPKTVQNAKIHRKSPQIEPKSTQNGPNCVRISSTIPGRWAARCRRTLPKLPRKLRGHMLGNSIRRASFLRVRRSRVSVLNITEPLAPISQRLDLLVTFACVCMLHFDLRLKTEGSQSGLYRSVSILI